MHCVADSDPRADATSGGTAVEVHSRRVTVVPPPGWRLLGGSSGHTNRKGSVTGWLELIDDEVCVTVRTGPFPASADELLDEILGVHAAQASPASRRHLRGANGTTWVLTEYHGPDDDYVAAALAVDCETAAGGRERVGVEVVAEGWADALESRAAVIESLISSIRC